VARYRGDRIRNRYFRGDAAFANPDIYEFLEEEGYEYAIRLKANNKLHREIEHLLTRPVGRPPRKPIVWFHSFMYQAESWSIPLAVMLAVPLGVFGAVAAIELRGLPNDVYFKVGLIAITDVHEARAGYDVAVSTEIFAENRDPLVQHEAWAFDPAAIGSGCTLVYHHSIGSDLVEFLRKRTGPRLLVFHNITPPDMVAEHDPALAAQLQRGIDDLPLLAARFPVAAGVSRFNCTALEAAGFTAPRLLPLCVDPARFNIPTVPSRMFELQDGRTNILFVGRVVANKCHHHLLEGFAAYLRHDPTARLLLVGGYDPRDRYYQSLEARVEELRLAGNVFFAGKVDEYHLHTYYRTAHLYWSMSAHEGFGVPFIEAMWFDVPVLAYAASAVPETLGRAGILFSSKDSWENVAALASQLVHNESLRAKVLAAQEERRRDFLPEVVLPRFLELLEEAQRIDDRQDGRG